MIEGFSAYSEEYVKDRVAEQLNVAINRGKTQTALAQEIGVSPSAITKYLERSTKPTHDTLVRIALVCGTSVYYLLTGLDVDEGLLSAMERAFEGIEPQGQAKLWEILFGIADIERRYRKNS